MERRRSGVSAPCHVLLQLELATAAIGDAGVAGVAPLPDAFVELDMARRGGSCIISRELWVL